MRTPLVSVLVLTYNNQDGIYPTLDSIFMQRYPSIEIVISDDGSEEFDRSALEDYIAAHKGKNIQQVRIDRLPENRGTVCNTNHAIRMSSGEYIFSLSPDDFMTDESVLETYVAFMEEHPVPVAFGKLRGVTPEGEYRYELLSCDQDFDKLRSWDAQTTLEHLFRRNFLPAPTMFLRRSTYEKYGYHDEEIRLIEDYPYWIHLCLQGETFGYLDKVMVDYGLTGVSSTGVYGKMFMKDMHVIYEKYIFPNDHRYGVLQKPYNFLKKSGLNYYDAKACWDEYSSRQKAGARVKYAPFFAYTALLDKKVEKKNRRHGADADA